MSKNILGIIQLVTASICFGFLGIFGRIAFKNDLSIGELLTYRFTFAALILWAYFLLFKRDSIRIGKKQLLISSALGLFGYAIFSTLYFTAVKGVSLALAAMLLFTYPFWVSIGSHFIHKDKLSVREWLFLLLAFIGLSMLVWGEIRIDSLLALGAGLLSAICYATYILLSSKYQKDIAPLQSSLYVITASAIGLFLIHHPEINRVPSFNYAEWGSIMGLAVICTIFSLTLVLSGLQKVKASHASMFTMVEPITAAISAYFIFGESLSLVQIVGMGLVLIAIFFK